MMAENAPRRRTAAEKRIAQMRHHDEIVCAILDAIGLLLGPFSENDEVPGNIEDAVEILRSALASPPGEPTA